VLAVVLHWWEAGLGTLKGSFQLLLSRFCKLILFLRSEGSCPFPSYTRSRWRERVAAPDCAFPGRRRLGGRPGARGVWAVCEGLGGRVCPAFQLASSRRSLPMVAPGAWLICRCSCRWLLQTAAGSGGGVPRKSSSLKIKCPCPGWH